MKPIISFDAGDTLFKGTAFKKIQTLTSDSEDNVKSAFKIAYSSSLYNWQDLDIFATNSAISAFWAEVYIKLLEYIVKNKQEATRLYSELMHIREHKDWYELREGVKEMLEVLEDAGYRIIVSSNWSTDLPEILEKLEIKNHFKQIYTSANFGFSKPNNNFYKLISELEKSKNIIHFGDDEKNDVTSPTRFGWKGVLVTKGDNLKRLVIEETNKPISKSQ